MKEFQLYLALILLVTTVTCIDDVPESNALIETDTSDDSVNTDTDTNADTDTEIKPEERISEIDTKEERKSKQFWPFFHR